MIKTIRFKARSLILPLVFAGFLPFPAFEALAQTNCAPPASGLVSWWRGETNAVDQVGANNGILAGNATFGGGKVGQAFVFDGDYDGVQLGSPTNLQLQNFTIEAWIARGSTSLVSSNSTLDGYIFGFGTQGYCLALHTTGRPLLSKVDVDEVIAPTAIADTNLHHVAVTKSGTTVVFYIDAVASAPLTYNVTFSFITNASIGASGDTLRNSFIGTIDEVSIYDRALSAVEIQSIYNAGTAGKCTTPIPPFIVSQPSSQTVGIGDTAIFSVIANGTPPLTYQWSYDGSALPDSTNASLVLPGVTTNQAGIYWVAVSNLYGGAVSTNAMLTIVSLETNLFDNFDPIIHTVQWTAFGGTVLATNFGGFVSSPNSLWFGGDGSRYAVTRPLDCTSGGRVVFDLRIANGASYPWERADIPAEGIVLEYSASSGTNWVEIGRYDTSVYTNWTRISVAMPPGAQTNGTQFRWRQLSNSGAPFDHWALDDVLISTGPTVPAIVTQPQSQTILAGGTATFIVAASGTPPLSYQWLMNGTTLTTGTTNPLIIPNAQASDAGSYSVIVSNTLGAATSSVATLTVLLPQTNCTPDPTGLISWWPAEGNALDQAGGNHGTLVGNTAYGASEVGQSFVLDGNGDAVQIGNPVNLQLQSFTIECWIQRASTTQVTYSPITNGNGMILSYGSGGYAIYIDPAGHPALTKVGATAATGSAAITDTNLHHLAVTKSGTTVVFYLDGAPYPAASYGQTFTFSTGAAIGARGDTLANSLLGRIDELAVYNRALSISEIQSIYTAGSFGKCAASVAPFVTAQPGSQTVGVGGSATFTVTAGGTPLLSYRWNLNGADLPNATNSSLTLTGITTNQAGSYACLVSNQFGAALSSNANLTVVGSTCVTPPLGLVSWWRAEGNAVDQAGANNGILAGNATYGTGKVGQGFVFDGDHDAVQVGNPTNLQLQNLTIETWLARSSASKLSSVSSDDGFVFGFGSVGYCLALSPAGNPELSKVDVDVVVCPVAINNTNLHHLAVTRSGSTVVFYIDGVASSPQTYGAVFGFTANAAIGACGDTLRNGFLGKVDELSIYNRALSAAEVQSIYNSGSVGKCSSPVSAFIVSQPANQTVDEGDNVTFSVTAGGTSPLTYQWNLNGSLLANATNASLSLTGVTTNQAGAYSLSVTNLYGSAISSNAILIVNPLNCQSSPTGLVSWWRAEGNALDQAGANNGTLAGNATYGSGKVGQAFVFDGDYDGVQVGSPTNLQLQNFTIEAWIARSSASLVSANPSLDGFLFGFGSQGYCMAISTTGRPLLSKVDVDAVFSPNAITDTSPHHVAVTRSGSTVVFYIDGVASAPQTYGAIFSFVNNAAIGACGDTLRNCFLGRVDEVSIYNRALSGGEIQSIYHAGSLGKCVPVIAPFIVSQPTNQTVMAGGSAGFTVSASGTLPLSYQWSRNSVAISGATASSLTLSNVQVSQAGNYSVTVTNRGGSAVSSNALLTVNLPPALVQVGSTNVSGGATVVVPVYLTANGNENAIGFSLTFDPSLLTYAGVNLGSGAAGATLFINTSQAGNGNLGMALAMQSDSTFSSGTQEVVQVSFTAALITNTGLANVALTDVPIIRQLSDVVGNPLPASYSGGVVSVSATDFEGDVSPRPGGDKVLSITDWVLVGRYAAGLDSPTNTSEFQRADCAPRSSLGDGAITVTDWVQAGRYAAALDPATAVGGPTAPSSLAPPGPKDLRKDGGACHVNALNTMLLPGQTGTVCVVLEAQGKENAVGFSLLFDPTVLNYTGAALGSGAGGAFLNLNASQAASGRLGAALALGAGSSFASGTHEVLRVNFRAVGSVPGDYAVSFTNLPVRCQVSDTNAVALTAAYSDAAVTINPFPSLKISHSGPDIRLSWPLWASNFVLQQASDVRPAAAAWSNLPASVIITNGEYVVALPLSAPSKLYRLYLP